MATIAVSSGMVMVWPGDKAKIPKGFVPCDGRSLPRKKYPDLFTAIGTAHGAPDGAHFNIPKYNGLVLQGVDDGAGVDPDAGGRTAIQAGGNTGDLVGSLQAAGVNPSDLGYSDPGHVHAFLFTQGVIAGGPPFYLTVTGPGANLALDGAPNLNATGSVPAHTTGISFSGSGSRTRAANANVFFVIKT